ncbi:MAG: Gfo/Idh/MocA family oxidoreductase [Phycisphaeraceae bacterium]|nr:Gfo/Idh/MocA family oxidoreductase [Phycisphaeraceae bacterium]
MPTPNDTHSASPTPPRRAIPRRDFVKAAAGAVVAAPAFAAASPFASSIARTAHAAGLDSVRVGVIGCGGRGTGAAANALEADPGTRITCLADAMEDRARACRDNLAGMADFADRAQVPDDRCHTGLDAYKRVLEADDVDYVILATPPGFRPEHFEAAIAAGKHVFMEKPVAVDGPGIRRVLAAADTAERRRLCVVAGTQRRHEDSYLAAMNEIASGRIGEVVSAHVYWNQGGLWVRDREPHHSDLEWQIRNWLYFTWLSGDHIVEQHVHNLDVANWAMGDHPVSCMGMGGRQVRTGPQYGHIFDHFAVEYEYPGGRHVTSMCRQIDGCAGRVEERIFGTRGRLTTRPGFAVVEGADPWRFAARNPNPYAREHADLIAAIRTDYINEARRVAESTLTAIMGRMSAYTGKEITWEQALNSQQNLVPARLDFQTPIPVPPVAIPGQTPVV